MDNIIVIAATGIEIDFILHDFGVESAKHINFKETDMARRAVEWCAEKFQDAEIRLAVDNSTAKMGLTRFVFTADAELECKLERTEQHLLANQCSLMVVQVRGLDEAADERSRGRR